LARRVIIIGGGIIGAAFAHRLQVSGADVTLLDAEQKSGGVATPNSWAWINASWGNAENYFRLRHHAMALWQKLDKEVPGLVLQWTGGLLWDLPETELRAFVSQQSAWGYEVSKVEGDEISKIEPNVKAPPPVAAYAKGEGAVEPNHAVEKLLDAAKRAGADVLQGVRATRLIEDDGRIIGVMTDDGILKADDVVLCGGVATAELLKPLGVDLAIDAPPGLLVHTEPAGEMLNGLIMAPELHVRQTPDGCLVAGSDFGGMDPGQDAEAAAEKLFERLQGFVINGDALKFSHYTVGYRPTPRDGVSMIGRLEGLNGLYLCCTHSGITLAPALAELGTLEIMTDAEQAMLELFRPTRLMSKI
jgi:glycine/D-amino acid oxidase-like deaminating enzyme